MAAGCILMSDDDHETHTDNSASSRPNWIPIAAEMDRYGTFFNGSRDLINLHYRPGCPD